MRVVTLEGVKVAANMGSHYLSSKMALAGPAYRLAKKRAGCRPKWRNLNWRSLKLSRVVLGVVTGQ